jgi:hypothetical protein
MPTLQRTSGGLNLYSSGSAGPFEESSIAAATVFAGHAAVTLFNAALYAGARDEVAQTKQAMASRAQIEQAKGIIIREHRCTRTKRSQSWWTCLRSPTRNCVTSLRRSSPRLLRVSPVSTDIGRDSQLVLRRGVLIHSRGGRPGSDSRSVRR